MTPELRLEMPSPARSACSSTQTPCPPSARARATASPTTPAPTTAEARPIKLGQSVTGELAETDAVQEDDGTYYDTWTVEARAGQRLVATMESDAFDAYLWFGRTVADEFTALASTDD